MIKESQAKPRFDVEYYLIGEEVARVKYDPRTEEYFDGEIMDASGEWEECPVNDILMDGREVSEREAFELIRELGGVL